MHLAPCHLPDEPALYSSEEEIPAFCPLSRARNVVEYPCKLGPAEVRICKQSRPGTDHVLMRLESGGIVRSPSALPHDCVIYRFSGFLVPYDRCFPLVGDTDPGDILICQAGFEQSFLRRAHLRSPDLHRIVFDPALVREYLCELSLHDADDLTALVVDYRP